MRANKWFILGITILLCAYYLCVATVAHSGRTDGNGGHRDNVNGGYHYHHGYSAHQHYDMDGDGKKDCPYTFDDKTNHSTNSSTEDDSSNSQNTITFWDVLKAMLTELIPAIILGFGVTYILWLIFGLIFSLIFNKDIGCSTYLICFVIVSVVSYICLIYKAVT